MHHVFWMPQTGHTPISQQTALRNDNSVTSHCQTSGLVSMEVIS